MISISHRSHAIIGYEINSVIQTSLRTELKSDVSVITVAHRSHTIMDYDKIVSILSM